MGAHLPQSHHRSGLDEQHGRRCNHRRRDFEREDTVNDPITYDRAQMRQILRAFKSMSDEAIAQARKVSGELAGDLGQAISLTSRSLGPAAAKVGTGYRVKKSSKIGELTFGFRTQRFSGGGTSQELWPGLEFGSNRLPQFAPWSGGNPRGGRGSKGKFIYPTLRQMQPYLIRQWESAFSDITKEWTR